MLNVTGPDCSTDIIHRHGENDDIWLVLRLASVQGKAFIGWVYRLGQKTRDDLLRRQRDDHAGATPDF